jgi:hypothetical protein
MPYPTEPQAPRPLAASPRVCPACGSDRIATIFYGSPSHEVLQQYAAGRVVLGGIAHAWGAPTWYCRECERRWRDPQ